MLMKHNELDEIDIEILNILQRDGRAAVKEIAKKVCLSSPAVSNRIERLEQDNYIRLSGSYKFFDTWIAYKSIYKS